MSYKVVRVNRRELILISYNSVVAMIDDDISRPVWHRIVLYKDWDYGRTTVGHVTRFINAYTPLKVQGKKGILKAIKDGHIFCASDCIGDRLSVME